MNKCMLTCVVVFLGLTMGMNLAYAVPIEIVVEGQLTLDGDDLYNLKGAQIEIRYTADSTDTPTDIESFSGGITSFFDVFLMTVKVTNRPDGAEDMLNLSVMNDPMANNCFPPSSGNDSFWFDNRPFYTEGIELEVGAWGMDLVSQEFFPGTGHATDLSFLLGLEQNWTGVFDVFDVTVGIQEIQYFINDITVSIIPEPATMLLLGLGGMFLRSRKF